jgi:ribose transport system permease protein
MRRSLDNIGRLLEGSAIAFVLLAVIVVLSLARSQFLTSGNITNILEQVSMIGIIAMGMTMLLVSANFDLSVGGIVGLTGVLAAKVMNSSGLVVGVIVAILIATALGAVNGSIVTRLKVNSLVATLGTGLVFGGLALLISDNAPITLTSTRLPEFINSEPLGVSVPVYAFAGVIALSAWLLHGTVGGRQLYAVGANREAARYAGIRVELLRFMPFVLTGAFCGVASVILIGLLSSAVPEGAESWPLQVVAAVVVGGVSIAGGRGTIFMAVIGVLLIGVINNGLNLLGLAASWQNIATGAILVLAVAIDALLRARSKPRAARTASAAPVAGGATTASENQQDAAKAVNKSPLGERTQ